MPKVTHVPLIAFPVTIKYKVFFFSFAVIEPAICSIISNFIYDSPDSKIVAFQIYIRISFLSLPSLIPSKTISDVQSVEGGS